MGWQPGKGSGAGAGPDRDPGALSWFARDADGRDALVPSGLLALAAEQASGPERRCPGASDDELVGLLRGWAAIESWAAAGKLGVIAELIRRDDQPLKGGTRQDRGHHGDLPDEWSPSLAHELALALACSVQSAQTTAWLAWELKARLPGTGALLHGGTLTLAKARAVIETFQCLTDADAAAAEALILGQLPGKTYPQVLRLAEQAALTVDPELAERRRAETARRHARVTFFRELAGTAGLSGRDLPPDEALAAMAAVNARAQEYEDSGAFGDAPMDALRAYAYLDLLTGTPAAARIACAVAQDEAADVAEALAWANARAARNAAQAKPGDNPGCAPEPAPEPGAGPEDGDATQAPVGPALADPDDPAAGHGDSHRPSDRDSGDDPGYDDDPGDDGDCGDDGDLGGDGRPGGGKPGGGSPGSASPGPGGPGSARPGSDGACPAGPSAAGPGSGATGASTTGRTLQPRLPDLVVPLLTLLGLAERPGEVQGFGLLDPALARSLAAAAVTSPRTEICVTVTSPEGYAAGHGCARRERPSRLAGQPATQSAGRLRQLDTHPSRRPAVHRVPGDRAPRNLRS